MQNNWRIIDSFKSGACYNMALDEAIARNVRQGNSLPTLRLYGWDVPSVSIGCFQKISDIEVDYCRESGIPVVRRPTGGRAILHDDELTYSFSVRTDNEIFSRGLLDSYRKISSAINLALSLTGLLPELKLTRDAAYSRSPLCFQSASYGEISVSKKKITGSAQKRWPDGLLQQGTVAYRMDIDGMKKVFRDKSGLDDVMGGLQALVPGLDRDCFKKTVIASFEKIFGIRFIPGRLSEKEEALVQEFLTQKYLTDEWNLQR